MDSKPNPKIDEIIAVLHMLRSRYYVASSLDPDGVKIFSVEPKVALFQNQYIKICKVANVKIRPLDNVNVPEDVLKHPRAEFLIEKVGKPPIRRLFLYTFKPVGIRLIQRFEEGAEFYDIDESITGKPIIVHVAHIYYVAYVSRSNRVYDEVPGGAKAYMLYRKGQLTWPQTVYTRREGHRVEIGVRIPIDEEQINQVISYLYSCPQQ